VEGEKKRRGEADRMVSREKLVFFDTGVREAINSVARNFDFLRRLGGHIERE